MAKPILLSVDDDSDVLRAIERDLRSKYGAEYRVMGSDSPQGALDLLKQLKFSNDSVALRDFLADNHVPYQWIDVEASGNDPETKRLLEALGPEAANLPVVLFPDGTKLLEGAPAEVAQKVGLRTRAQTDFYDLAIVGGGPAGLAAAVYGASEGLHTVMIEKEAPGGQAGMSARIENYLGFPIGLSGGDLARRAVVQAQRFGVEILSPLEAVGVRTEGSYRIIKLADGNEISCHALMVATGVQWRRA